MSNPTPTSPRYWGWGQLDHEYDRDKTQRFLGMLCRYYGLKELPPQEPHCSLNSFKLGESQFSAEFANKWKERGLSLEPTDRILHAAGKSYRDLVRVRSGQLPRFPDGVLFLRRSDDLADLFIDAATNGITLIPFGGGTGVVGGTECVGPSQKPILVVNLKNLDRLLSIDEQSLTVRVEAGMLGPKLEELLNRKGFTLGHFPQSFEFSSVGGWVATRSAGQTSTRYGKIEDMVQSLTLWSPKGQIKTNEVPASATGPSLKQLLVGSEGIYGIITEVTLKIAPEPKTQKFVTAFFREFSAGMTCCRQIMQAGLKPSIMRLSDGDETAMFLELMLKKTWQKKLAPHWFKWKHLGSNPCFLLLATEGLKEHASFELEKAKDIIAKNNGAALSLSLHKKWKHDRFELPYLRDDLMDHGFFIDTLETATTWSRLPTLYGAMKKAFAIKSPHRLMMACHLSHAYADGASLYFTFMGVQDKGNEITQWETIKNLATEVIVSNRGALSHHHGIGFDHRKWMPESQTPLGIEVLTAVKRELDPEGLLNPGKVI